MLFKGSSFYPFLGFHSFLIGLFPFFVPVFLWKQGYQLSHISFFIALTGIGFVISLWVWDRVHKKYSLSSIITISFVLEILLLSCVVLSSNPFFLIFFALINGAYNCFFWITQRALFFETISTENSGKKFGNFQIFVAIILKIGIFTGGLLLEHAGYLSVYLLSIAIAILGILTFLLVKQTSQLADSLIRQQPLTIPDIVNFRDRNRSIPVFIIDGLFLFLESYFWVISLFLLAHESFWKLGILVIVLALTFSVLFFFIKNTIDKLGKQMMYTIAVIAYSISWLLRSQVEDGLPLSILLLLLVLITFGTSFFRLAFNKRFFDIAKETSAHRYLFLKSYYSQIFISVFFTAIGITAALLDNTQGLMTGLYFMAALISVLFLYYRPDNGQKQPTAVKA